MNNSDDNLLWFMANPHDHPQERIEAALRLVDALETTEMAIFVDDLTLLYGNLTDDKLYDIAKNCHITNYTHITGRERRYFYRDDFIVGFSERWRHSLMMVSVQRPNGNNSLFELELRHYYDR